jgi:hypothetical protein
MTEENSKFYDMKEAYFTFYADGSATLTAPTYEISAVDTVVQYKKKNGRHATRTITTYTERKTGVSVVDGGKNVDGKGFNFKSY